MKPAVPDDSRKSERRTGEASPLSRMFRICDTQGQPNFNRMRRSLRIHGHSTTIRLEAAFWDVLDELAERENCSIAELVAKVDEHCPIDHSNLASCLRVLSLVYVIIRGDPYDSR